VSNYVVTFNFGIHAVGAIRLCACVHFMYAEHDNSNKLWTDIDEMFRIGRFCDNLKGY